MSQDTSSSNSASAGHQEFTSLESARFPVTFGLNGQPVGTNSSQLCTTIGRVVKTYVPPTYDRWTNVPADLKDQVWQIVSGLYDVPKWHKQWVIRKANVAWKDWKCILRRDIYDKYLTDEERKKHIPHSVKKEDWVRFVDNCSTPEVQALRKMGKIARKALKSPHTSGRKGQARVAEELKKKNPAKEVTRTDIYVATHTKKDGSSTSQHMDAINDMIASDPSSAQRDLDHDPVAIVCGPDTRGRVRGMGMGVSKTAMHVSAPYKQALEHEQASHAVLLFRVNQLTERLEEESRARKLFEEKIFAYLSTIGPQIQSDTNLDSSSQARHDSPSQDTQSDTPTA